MSSLPPLAGQEQDGDAGWSIGAAPRVSAGSSVLERAKSNAKRVSASNHSQRPSTSYHETHKDRDSGRDERTHTAPLSPSSSPVSPMREHSTSDRQAGGHLPAPVEVSDDDSDEDTFTRISNAISKASSKTGGPSGFSRVSVAPGRKHEDPSSKKNVKQKISPKKRVYIIFATFELIILGVGLWVAHTIQSMTYNVELSSTTATLALSKYFLFSKVTRIASGFKSMSQEQLFLPPSSV